MKAILTPDISPALGLVIFKPSKELLPLFERGRVLIAPEPSSLKHITSGPVPDAAQPLAQRTSLFPFFMADRVLKALGGMGMLVEYVKSQSDGGCQATERTDDADYHFHRYCALHIDSGTVWLCHHHDNHYRAHGPSEALLALAGKRRIEWILSRILCVLGKESDHVLSLQELCWWAFTSGTAHCIPDHITREAAGIFPRYEGIKSVYKESELIVDEFIRDESYLVKCCKSFTKEEQVSNE